MRAQPREASDCATVVAPFNRMPGSNRDIGCMALPCFPCSSVCDVTRCRSCILQCLTGEPANLALEAHCALGEASKRVAQYLQYLPSPSFSSTNNVTPNALVEDWRGPVYRNDRDESVSFEIASAKSSKREVDVIADTL
jgi:hypothetical protein